MQQHLLIYPTYKVLYFYLISVLLHTVPYVIKKNNSLLRILRLPGYFHSRPQSPRFVWSAVKTSGSENTAFRMS